MKRGFLEEEDSVEVQRMRGLEVQGLEGRPHGPAPCGGRCGPGVGESGAVVPRVGAVAKPWLRVGTPPRARAVMSVVRVVGSAGVLGVLLTWPPQASERRLERAGAVTGVTALRSPSVHGVAIACLVAATPLWGRSCDCSPGTGPAVGVRAGVKARSPEPVIR